MKISYRLRWNPETGTAYRQTFRITEEENQTLFYGIFDPGMNYGDADTGHWIASKIYGTEHHNQISRIIAANSAVFVGAGKIPVYYD
jgi:hypothetical protein